MTGKEQKELGAMLTIEEKDRVLELKNEIDKIYHFALMRYELWKEIVNRSVSSDPDRLDKSMKKLEEFKEAVDIIKMYKNSINNELG